jgi:hypothetical protein
MDPGPLKAILGSKASYKDNHIFMSQPKYRIVTVTIVTICDSVLWRLKEVTMRLVLESIKSLVLASSYWDFSWRPAFILQNPSHFDSHKCDGYRKLQKSFFSLLFCDYLWLCLFLYFTSVLNIYKLLQNKKLSETLLLLMK